MKIMHHRENTPVESSKVLCTLIKQILSRFIDKVLGQIEENFQCKLKPASVIFSYSTLSSFAPIFTIRIKSPTS